MYNLHMWPRAALHNLAGRIQPARRGLETHGLKAYQITGNNCTGQHPRFADKQKVKP
jgi:hypothetical protein